ncbi:MAG TPA: DUF5808 domain-containing protein [Gemmatimonadaceae bacterium]
MERDELNALWRNPDHWNRDTSYNCANDPRLLVPSRVGLGWTLNMAHPRAQLTIWLFLLCVIGIVAVVGFRASRSG